MMKPVGILWVPESIYKKNVYRVKYGMTIPSCHSGECLDLLEEGKVSMMKPVGILWAPESMLK